MTIFEESAGVHSMRRFLAFASFGNAIALSWGKPSWEIIAVFVGASLVLLGLTTVGDIANIRSELSGNSGQLREPVRNPDRLGE